MKRPWITADEVVVTLDLSAKPSAGQLATLPCAELIIATPSTLFPKCVLVECLPHDGI